MRKEKTSRSNIESEIEMPREERMVESTSLSIYFLPPNSVGVAENYDVGGQGSLKAKQVQDMTKNTEH